MKKRVIIVTDGDLIAKEAVEEASRRIGGRCISMSAGNPTPLNGSDIIELIKRARYDPVVVMVDDRGNTGKGKGEEAMGYIIKSHEIEFLGVIAVASNTKDVKGIKVNCSIDKYGNLTKKAVRKNGDIKKDKIIKGDTVDILNDIHVPIIVGIGDPGKMDGRDSLIIGAPVITMAMQEIIKRHDGI